MVLEQTGYCSAVIGWGLCLLGGGMAYGGVGWGGVGGFFRVRVKKNLNRMG